MVEETIDRQTLDGSHEACIGQAVFGFCHEHDNVVKNRAKRHIMLRYILFSAVAAAWQTI
jgi:hypothetical protein